MIFRLLIVGLVVGLGYVGVRSWERRSRGKAPWEPGVTVVTADWCRGCGPAIEALRRHGVEPRLTDVRSIDADQLGIRALPVAVVADQDGHPILWRAGRSVVDNAADIARAASLVTA